MGKAWINGCPHSAGSLCEQIHHVVRLKRVYCLLKLLQQLRFTNAARYHGGI